MDDKIKDFESAVSELEKVVKTLEAGEISLEKSLQLFERGVELSRFCHGRLADAERRVEILSEHGERKNAPDTLVPNQEANDQA
ncbi:MAG: exodeoxyribonuclease VII small subunit [Acidobacteriota bacterium]|nr:exodeoxyribonuclease VII small subunit [Acidobacteriota bacterium]